MDRCPPTMLSKGFLGPSSQEQCAPCTAEQILDSFCRSDLSKGHRWRHSESLPIAYYVAVSVFKGSYQKSDGDTMRFAVDQILRRPFDGAEVFRKTHKEEMIGETSDQLEDSFIEAPYRFSLSQCSRHVPSANRLSDGHSSESTALSGHSQNGTRTSRARMRALVQGLDRTPESCHGRCSFP